MKKELEFEVSYVAPDEEIFRSLLSLVDFDNYPIEVPFSIRRSSIFFDDRYHSFLKSNSALSVVTNANLKEINEKKLMFKKQLNLTTRIDSSVRLDESPISEQITDFAKQIPIQFDFNSMEPQFVMRQTRNKRYVETKHGRIYISIDECHFFRLEEVHNDAIVVLRVIEFETENDNKELRRILNKVSKGISNSFRLKKTSWSKYKFGAMSIERNIR